jgi:hypothetical protein
LSFSTISAGVPCGQPKGSQFSRAVVDYSARCDEPILGGAGSGSSNFKPTA